VHDILESHLATGRDATDMSRGHHYSYPLQTWIPGHDHAHLFATRLQDLDTVPLKYCGADLETCTVSRENWNGLNLEVS